MDCVRCFDAPALPTVSAFDMLLVMGGPMNIYETAQHPWLDAEKALIREAIEAGRTVVGVCLGSQLIADQLGSPVYRGILGEIGWWPVARVADCPADLPLPDNLQVYHWHGDTFDLPVGAHHLLESAACHSQGFLYGDRVLGLQCHLEATPASIRALIDACGDELREGPYFQSAARMLSEPATTFQTMHGVLFQLLDHLTRHA